MSGILATSAQPTAAQLLAMLLALPRTQALAAELAATGLMTRNVGAAVLASNDGAQVAQAAGVRPVFSVFSYIG